MRMFAAEGRSDGSGKLGSISKMTAAEKRAAALRSEFRIRAAVSVFGTSVGDPEQLSTFGVTSPMIDALVESLAQNGATLLNGGYLGTMRGLARRVLEKGGSALGFAASTISDPLDRHCYSEIIMLDDHWERLALLVEAADAFIALPGGVGTLTEISTALWAMDRGLCRRKPLLLLGEYWRSVFGALSGLPMMFRSQAPTEVMFVENPETLRRILEKL
jgi:predicted Rossmann-fold nucleotide-binding protein